jgi:outer membrane protein
VNTNQLSLILNVVLLLAVGFLYYAHFSNSATPSIPSGASSSTSIAGQQVVYINTDSLLMNYEFVTDLQKDLNERRQNAERQLGLKEQQLQQEAMSFQKRASAGLMSELEMKNTQNTLMQKEQQLRGEQQNLAQGLMDMERQMSAQWLDTTITYLRAYNKSKNFQYILGYTKGGGILLANDKFDITSEILKGLNDNYKASKTSSPTTTEPKKEEKK